MPRKNKIPTTSEPSLQILLGCLYVHKENGKAYATKRWLLDKTRDIEMIEYVEVKFSRPFIRLMGVQGIRQRTVRKRGGRGFYCRTLEDFQEKFRSASAQDIEGNTE